MDIELTTKQRNALEEHYEECEFKSNGHDCCECWKEPKGDRLWFESTSFEYIEGNYYCDWCALYRIKEETAAEEIYWELWHQNILEEEALNSPQHGYPFVVTKNTGVVKKEV